MSYALSGSMPGMRFPPPHDGNQPGPRATRLMLLVAAGWLAVAVCPGGQVACGADPDEAADAASESDSFREVQEQSQAKKSSSRKGVKASASASGMMSGSAGGRSMGNGFGGGQGQGSGSQMGPGFGRAGSGAGSGAASNAALNGQMKMKVSISTDDDDEEEEPNPDTLDPYVPGGPGSDEADDANVMRRMEGGRRITTIERAGETITITDSPTRIVVHRLDRTVDPPASSYVAATSPRALAAKDPAAYDLFDRYVVKTPASRPTAAPARPGRPVMPGMPAMPDMPELPRTGNPEMDRMLDDFFKSQQ